MKDYLREQVGLTLAAMAGVMPTEIEAIEQAVIRSEEKARNVVDFREAADFYCGDMPEYQLAKLRRIRQYLRERGDHQAERVLLATIQVHFGEDE